MSKIFLSHSSQDNFEAVALRDWLAEQGFDEVFLDIDPDRGIAAGERWERKLHEAANRCEAVVFLVSANWLASGWCLREYTLARTLNKKLFAVIMDPTKSIQDLPAELKGTWQAVNLVGGQDGELRKARLPGSHVERHIVFSRDGLRRLKRGLDAAGLDPKFFAWPPQGEPDRPPFRGLKPLEASDAGIFFGREAAIIEASDRMRGLTSAAPPRLLVILGASGAGKSSFLRAGLLPRLARDDRHFAPLPVIRPERAALTGETGLLRALEAALPSRDRAQLRKAMEAGAEALRPLLRELAPRSSRAEGEVTPGPSGEADRSTPRGEALGPPPTLILAIDQAEELFRPEGRAESEALLELIRDLTQTDDPAIIVIFAIRSDSYDALEHAKPLEGLPQSTLPLLPMPRGAYKDVIEGPARRYVQAGKPLSIEPRLVERLLADVAEGGGADALPLLAFTLEQLFADYRGSAALTAENYEEFGGLKGAIDAAINRAFRRADVDPRIPQDRKARETLLRRGLIPWLAGIDPDSKSPRRNMARRSEIPVEAAPLLDLLIEERLLSTDVFAEKDAQGVETRVVTLEPAHEALLRQWGLLQGWLEEDFALLATLEGVKRAASEWEANGGEEAWLAHGGQRLADAQRLDARADIAAKLGSADRAYLVACRAKEDATLAQAETRRREREEEQARRLADARALASARGRVAWAAGLGLIAALGLAGAAVWEWRDANAQRERAEKTLALATQTANGLVFDLAQKFREVAGVPVAMIKDILDRARALQDQLIGQGQASSDMLRTRAATLGETASTLLIQGDSQGALAAALEAKKAFEQLSFGQPANPDLTRELSVALDHLGDIRVALGDLAAALASYRESLAIAESLSRLDLGNTQWRRDISVSLSKIGEVQVAQGDLPAALTSFRSSLAIAESLAKSDPGNVQSRRDLSVSYSKVGEVQVAQGDLAAALASYQADLAIAESLSKSDPGNAGWRRDLSVSYERIGDIQVAQGDLAAALASYRAGLAISESLAKADLGNARWKRDLSVSYGKVGDVQIAQGDLTGAIASYQADLAIAESLYKADPGNSGWKRDLSVSYGRVGDVQFSQGDLAAARASYQAGLAIAESLARSDPGNRRWMRDLSVSYNNLGDVQAAQGELPAALKSYQDSFAIRARLSKADPGNAGWRRDLSVSHLKVGNIQVAKGDLDAALASYQEGLAIAESLAKADLGNTEWKRNLSVFYNKIGDIQLARGDLPGALKSCQDSVGIAESLAKADPANAEWKRDLSISYDRLGDVLVAQGDLAAALTSYRDSLAIADSLAKAEPRNAGWKRDVAVSYAKLAKVYTKAAQPLEARAALETGRAILAQLVAEHPDAAQWGRDLAWFEEEIGALGK